jgi:hypothetical protein
MATKPTAADKERIIRKQMRASIEAVNDFEKSIDSIVNQQEKLVAQQELYADRQRLINDLMKNFESLNKSQVKELSALVGKQAVQLKTLKELNKLQKNNLKLLEKEKEIRGYILDSVKSLGSQLAVGWKYLMESDKVIKNTILNLGLSGARAKEMRLSFERSASYAASLGATLADIQTIQEGFANETGRARVLSDEMLKSVLEIGKGTGLGVEQAMQLASQFELMGLNANSSAKYVQGVVDTSERMGVNTTKVLKSVSDNFKKLNTMTFQQGVKGFAQMAQYAEKMNISMTAALDVGETSKSLEGAIDLVAQLQVMGGEFAKADPFELLYLKRNDPVAFTKKIGDMTKGIVTFRKMTDGTFEKFVSPLDRDRLASVAKTLGISVEDMTKMGERQAEFATVERQISGLGLSEREKELLKNASFFNADTRRFEVTLAGRMQDISNLTKEQAKSFIAEQATLAKRAKDSQTFEEVFKNTINAFKTGLLPALNVINKLLNSLMPISDALVKFSGQGEHWKRTALILLAAGSLFKAASWGIGKGMTNWVGTGNVWGKETGRAPGKLQRFFGGRSAPGTAPTGPQPSSPRGGGVRGRGGAGLGMMRGGAGIGAAALGIGAGIGLAALGISKLADAMAKLDDKKAEALQGIVRSISILSGVGIAASVAIAIISRTAQLSAAPLAEFGVALMAVGAGVALIGVGIGAATAGIGYLLKGIGDMRLGKAELVKSIGSTATAFKDFKIDKEAMKSINAIAKTAPDFKTIGNSFANINAVLTGSRDNWIAVQNAIESISRANTNGGGMLSDLANLLKSPLKVEFANKEVAVVSNITMNIDGYKLYESTSVNAHVQNTGVEQRSGLKGQGIHA